MILTSTTSIKRAKKHSLERKSIRHKKTRRLARNFWLRFYFFFFSCEIQAKINQTITFIHSLPPRPSVCFLLIDFAKFEEFSPLRRWMMSYFFLFPFSASFLIRSESRQPCKTWISKINRHSYTLSESYTPAPFYLISILTSSSLLPQALNNFTWSSLGGNRNYWNLKSFHSPTILLLMFFKVLRFSGCLLSFP